MDLDRILSADEPNAFRRAHNRADSVLVTELLNGLFRGTYRVTVASRWGQAGSILPNQTFQLGKTFDASLRRFDP